WKNMISASIFILLAWGLLKGKNWVRILELIGGILGVLFICFALVLPYLPSFDQISVPSNSSSSGVMLFILCAALVSSCLTIYGMTRDSSRCWCGMPRPLPANIHWYIIILALLSFTEFQSRFRLQQEKRNAFPVDTTLQVSVEGQVEPLDENEWRELKMRFERRRSRFPHSLKLAFDDSNQEVRLQGVAFNFLNLPVRLGQYGVVTVNVNPDSPKVIEVRLKKRNP
nr:hypothetical protein [Spirochaetales bacterium]